LYTVVAVVTLTELMIKQAKPREKSYTLSDGKGLLLEIFPNGRKRWVVRYWVDGREKRTSIGTFPDVSLKVARDQNYELRKNLASGNPIKKKSETFADVAKEWLELRVIPVHAEDYIKILRSRLDRYILPVLGGMALADITTGTVLNVCRQAEARGFIEVAKRVRIIVGQIFRYGIATDRINYDPTYGLKGALQARKETHYPTITDPVQIGLLLSQIEKYPFLIVRSALQFSILTFCRPQEIRAASWTEIDLEKAQWNIPEERMKMKRPHIVPLSRQAIAVLEKLREVTGLGKWLFPSARNDGNCMSRHTVRIALRTIGYNGADIVPHGFRAMASTIFNENGFSPEWVEMQLAHASKNAVREAYNHAKYLPQRREMMQWWADWLEGLAM
jgi:integrase